MKLFQFKADIQNLPEAMDFLEARLKKLHVSKKGILNSMLIAEESIVQLIENADEDATVSISVNSKFMAATVYISAKGKKINSDLMGISMPDGTPDSMTEQNLRAMMLRSYSNHFAYNWVDGSNHIMINCGKNQRQFAYQSFIALVFAFILAFVLRAVLNAGQIDILINRLLNPTQSIMLNLLTLVTAPTVFFSIVSFVSKCTGIYSSGKLSIRIISFFAFTSVISVLLGYLIFSVFKPGVEGQLADLVLYSSEKIEWESTILGMIADIVPSNIIAPFLNTKATQLLFLALICGVAVGRAGRFSAQLREMADAFDTLFSKILEIISGCIPFAAFVAILINCLSTGTKTIVSMLHFFVTVFIGMIGLLLLYSLMVTAVGLNPLPFIRKCTKLIRHSLLDKSSVEAVPATIRCCKNELGISNDICSIAIPLGAVGNLDANCIYLTISVLYLIRICSMGAFVGALIPLAIMILLLSLGSPITPGSVILTLTMLSSYSGISIAAVSLLFGLNAFIELFLSACNSAGDVAVALILAKRRGKLDKKVYNS